MGETFKTEYKQLTNARLNTNTLNMMDGGSVPAQGHQKEGLNCRTSISQLQKSIAGGRLSTAEKTDLWYLKLGLAISPSLLL